MCKLIEAEWCIHASVNDAIIVSDNGLPHVWCQAIIWTNAGLLLIGPLGSNNSEFLIKLQQFSYKEIHLKMMSAKWHLSCLGCVNSLWPNPAIWWNAKLSWLTSWVVVSQLSLHYQTLSWSTSFEYGPVTMIVPVSGHQVRCIPWVQMGTFNKEIGFLCGLKFFSLNIFCWEYHQSSLHLMLQIWWKPLLLKMCQ